MSSPSNNSSLRPGWFKGSSGKGFQPPPTAPDRGDKGRAASIGSGSDGGGGGRDANKFAALLDDDDVVVGNGGDSSPTAPSKPSTNSRSEAFRAAGFHRSSSTGSKPAGRSLADLAAKVPEAAPGPGRRHSTYADGGRSGGGGGGARFSALRGSDGGIGGAGAGAIEAYKPDPKVVRYTREKLLSLRRAPENPDPGPPDVLKPLEGSAVYSETAQDPVCWDTLDAEAIWESVRERRTAPIVGKVALEGGDARRRNAPNTGRWTRGLALPPPEEAARRREREADNPNELWDDPTGGAIGAASDFSAFGAMPSDDGGAFDFDKMAEASRKLEEELHGKPNKDDDDDDDETGKQNTKTVDTSRPLASAGTTLVSGSGNNVNVFEDFDAPSAPGSVADENEAKQAEGETPTVRGGDEDPSASSRLMKMIGVTKAPDQAGKDVTVNPWGSDPVKATSGAVDPIIGAIGGGSLSLNPWGGPVAASAGSQAGGLGLGLGAFGAGTHNQAAEQQKREAEMRRRQQQEEEAQRRAMAEKKAREQHASMQQPQQPPQQSQIELVLMERICVILENSWGRSDLGSILATLHSEDSRVIPLLQNADSLRALIARSPQRVTLRRDPNFGGGEMAVLVLTNTQWQQRQQEQHQQQAQMQQEEIRRRRQMEEEASRAQAQRNLVASINFNAPWFYSDPQQNIQGPFRGEEMRQWLEAGYFKGDLPISQVASGPFHQLSTWFPDLKFAFTPQPANGKDHHQARAEEQAKARAAEEERRRNEAAEQERRAAEEARRAATETVQRQAAAREAERQAAMSKGAEANGDGAANQSSNQLKMMLGLQSGGQPLSKAEVADTSTPSKPKVNEKKGKAGNKKATQKGSAEAEAPALAPQPTKPAPAPAAPAWGGAANAKHSTKKSMSEIQQEEARAAAMQAAKRGSMPQPSSGWANVAAGTSGWSGGAVRPGQASSNTGAVASGRPTNQPPGAQTGANRKVAPLNQQQQRTSATTSSAPAEAFGAKIPPALEKWSREKIHQINGSDDITLIAFCMTLEDENDIHQYFSTYLGSSPQVTSFANEFINKRGLGSKQEEWETPGSAKKGRKKKSGK